MAGNRNIGEARKRRHERVRKRLSGNASRPRLCVFRSLNHIYAQVIDDEAGNTITCASTLDAEIKNGSGKKNKKQMAELVGAMISKRAQEKGIKQVVFDRAGYKYQGRVKALADAARKAGLRF
jgi:large subunit ribosomal protein L18